MVDVHLAIRHVLKEKNTTFVFLNMKAMSLVQSQISNLFKAEVMVVIIKRCHTCEVTLCNTDTILTIIHCLISRLLGSFGMELATIGHLRLSR
jgi:hypothetical protein